MRAASSRLLCTRLLLSLSKHEPFSWIDKLATSDVCHAISSPPHAPSILCERRGANGLTELGYREASGFASLRASLAIVAHRPAAAAASPES